MNVGRKSVAMLERLCVRVGIFFSCFRFCFRALGG